MNALYVVPMGQVGAGPMEWAAADAAEWSWFPVRVLPPVEVPPQSWDAARRQYQSVELMKQLVRAAPPDAVRVLGITECDLSIPLLTFLFGQAQLGGKVALVSLHRLRQEFYGMPHDSALLRERLAKEILHELGHTFGLTHCAQTTCAMSLSTHIEFVDAKSANYCESCAAQVMRCVRTLEKPQ